MTVVPRIENWSFTRTGDGYTAPEHRFPIVHGKVYGHPSFPDGSEIETSPIVKLANGKLWTRQSVYILGAVDPEYAKWAKEHRIDLPL